MVSAVIALVAATGPVPEPVDFQLGWKAGDKFSYTFGMKLAGLDSNGRMDITVTKADEKGLTVSWPSAQGSQGPPIVAGSVQLTRKGRVTTKGAVPDAGVNLIMLMLPEEPVDVGGEFKVDITINGLRFDLMGKLEKIDETNGRFAHFGFAGKYYAGGRATNVKQTSVFDMSRGLFTSGEMVIETGNITRYFKLVEDERAVGR